MYYLGIDWGQSKCGLAIADQENLIASPYRQVSTLDVYQDIVDLTEKEKIKIIVIGFNQKLLKRKGFNLFLEKIKRIGISVELENEDFSTQVAHRNLIDADQKKISQEDDIESSRIILQSWLDRKKKK